MYYYNYPRLKDCRNDKELTQVQVGKILGINSRTYSLYEIGRRQIPLHHLIELAFLYNTSIDYLTGLTNDIKPIYEVKKMNETNLLILRQMMNNIFKHTRKFNLYVNSPTYMKNPDIERAKEKITIIKELITEIELKIKEM